MCLPSKEVILVHESLLPDSAFSLRYPMFLQVEWQSLILLNGY